MKKYILLFFILFTIMAESGCVTTAENKYSESIHNYLQDKYGMEFEIVQLTKEFSGNEGLFLRAVCKAYGYSETFVVYAYEEYETNGMEYEMGNKTYTMVDDFYNILLAQQYSSQIREALGEDVFVKSRLLFSSHMLTKEEYMQGLEKCISNPDFHTYARIYILADAGKAENDFRQKAEQLLMSYDVHTQYLFIGYTDKMNEDRWNKEYYENYSEFSDYICDEGNDLAQRVNGTYLTSQDGIRQQIDNMKQMQ